MLEPMGDNSHENHQMHLQGFISILPKISNSPLWSRVVSCCLKSLWTLVCKVASAVPGSPAHCNLQTVRALRQGKVPNFCLIPELKWLCWRGNFVFLYIVLKKMFKDVSYFLKKLQASAYFLTYNPPEKNKISTSINVKYQLLTPNRKGLERLAPLICAATLSDLTGHR